MPSPQRGPAILQAGTSGKGRSFAARHADAIFAIQPNLAGAKAYYDDIKRGLEEAGRPIGACKILFGVQPIIGASRAEAADRQAEHNALVPIEEGSPSCPGTSISICRNCRSTRSWRIAPSPSCSACKPATAP